MKTISNNCISIIIVNWNGEKYLVDCLKSLFVAKSPLPLEIVIVDNGSTKDGSISYIKKLQKQHKNIVLVENSTNTGFAEGNNIGYRASHGKYLLFLNNDTIVDKNFLLPLLQALQEDQKIGAVQPKILMHPQVSTIDSAGSFFMDNGFLYHFGHNKPDQKKYDKRFPVFSMKGACMLFRREVIDKVGLFDPEYFAYFEETDLCQRTWIAGYSIWYIPESKIFHKGGKTANTLKQAFVQFHSYKNRMHTYMKNLSGGMVVRVIPLHMIFCLGISFVYLLMGQFQLALTVQKAIWWNLVRLRKIAKERTFVASIRKISDTEYLPVITKNVGLSYFYHLFKTSLAGYRD